MTRLACDGPTLIRSVAAAVANLERHVSEVDALNVFPVPDGDTGSNMLATMRAALAEADGLAPGERDLARVAAALGRGALRGARGSSGVILAQIVRGMSDGIDGRRRATGVELAAGLRRGAESAYGAVAAPVEGTILTVIRDAAEAAASEAARDRHVEAVLSEAIDAATRSVARTPALLPVLAETGVVDSGGQGLLRLLEGTRQLDGDATTADAGHGRAGAVTSARPVHRHEGGFGYETVYLVGSIDTPLDLEGLRRELDAIGDSVVVAGDPSTARVHVHGADPDLAIAVGLRAGRLSDIAIVDLDAKDDPVPASDRRLALIVLADGDGLAALLGSLGAVVVRSAQAIGKATERTEAAHAVVLVPTDTPRVGLIPSATTTFLEVRDVAALVAAALAFDRDAEVDATVARMAGEAERVRAFAVSDEIDPVAATVDGLRVHGTGGFELVTLYAGRGIEVEAIESVRSAIATAWPGVAVDVVHDAQVRHVLLVGVD